VVPHRLGRPSRSPRTTRRRHASPGRWRVTTGFALTAGRTLLQLHVVQTSRQTSSMVGAPSTQQQRLAATPASPPSVCAITALSMCRRKRKRRATTLRATRFSVATRPGHNSATTLRVEPVRWIARCAMWTPPVDPPVRTPRTDNSSTLSVRPTSSTFRPRCAARLRPAARPSPSVAETASNNSQHPAGSYMRSNPSGHQKNTLCCDSGSDSSRRKNTIEKLT
jgi:hypothetical protein